MLAWVGAISIGLALGMLGSGGSILTVPILVYLLGEPEKLAIAQSLAIVGLIALAAAIPYALKRQVHWLSVVWFGVPGMAGTYLGAWLSAWVPAVWQLALFAVVMLLAALFMLRPPTAAPQPHRSAWKIAVEGLAVGVLTGLVGVGGGFLIVPALVILGGLPMTLAVGTSLLIIALKSGSGLIKYLELLPAQGYSFHWEVVGLFAALGIVGSLAGNRLASVLSPLVLRRSFGVFLIAMGIFILIQNLPKAL